MNDNLSTLDGLYLGRRDGVATVQLQRPDVGNALTRPMVSEIIGFLEAASADRAVRVVVVRAIGDTFCTGADLRPPQPRPTVDQPRVLGDVARGTRTFWQRLICAVLDCEKPVVAALNGTAAGAGVQLALACDLVVSAESARLIEIFVRRGIAPDAGAAYLLTRLVGLQAAKRLCFLGRAVHADEALRLGLVVEVVPDAELDVRVDQLVAELAAGPTAAIAAAKRLINHAPDVDRATALWEEAQVQEAVVTATQDATEGLASFGERRSPRFVGY